MANASPLREETDLSRLFAPRAVALVGATDHPTSFGGRLFRQMLNFGFQGKIYPVNPRRKEIHGLTCFSSVRDLPQPIDHVGIIVSTERVFDVLVECAAHNVPFVTICSAGFAETGTTQGRERQAKLVAFARSAGMRIMGPNCNGVINFVDAFAMTSTGAIRGPRRPPGNVGVVSHSGGLGQINVMWRAQQAGLGISYEASCGNEADLDTLDFVRFMLRSDATDVILLAVESIKDGAKLRDVAREAVEREKPIVVLKFGRTAAGRHAAASHTGAVAGVDEIYDAAFRQYGLIRVNECNELYEMAILLRTRRWPRGRRAASVAASGGNIVQLADVGSSLGIDWPEYTADTQATLRELMPDYASAVSNPTDMTSLATGEPATYRRALDVIASAPNIDVIAPIFTFVGKQDILRGADFVRECVKPAVMLWTGGCTDDATIAAKDLVQSGVSVYQDALPCLRAVRAAMDFGALIAAHKAGGHKPDRPPGLNLPAARAKLGHAGSRLAEREAKQILADYGFPVTREHLATNATEAVAYARALGGEVVLKIDSPDILHKTEAGAVLLGLDGDDAINRGYTRVIDAAKCYAPRAHINGVLVQEMVPPGVEMMLGVIVDPVFGHVVAAGMGGIHVEVLRDVAYRVAPVSHDQALAMLHELRSFKILEGVRGMTPRDIDKVSDLIVRLSWFAHDFRNEILEMDINPLVVLDHGNGATVVDALIVRTDARSSLI